MGLAKALVITALILVFFGALVTAQQIPMKTLKVNVSGQGKVIISGANIDNTCKSVCSLKVPAKAEVTIKAVPAAGWKLYAWGGNECGGKSQCVFSITKKSQVTAIFTTIPKPLDLSNSSLRWAGSSGGTVSAPPTGSTSSGGKTTISIGGTNPPAADPPAPTTKTIGCSLGAGDTGCSASCPKGFTKLTLVSNSCVMCNIWGTTLSAMRFSGNVCGCFGQCS